MLRPEDTSVKVGGGRGKRSKKGRRRRREREREGGREGGREYPSGSLRRGSSQRDGLMACSGNSLRALSELKFLLLLLVV